MLAGSTHTQFRYRSVKYRVSRNKSTQEKNHIHQQSTFHSNMPEFTQQSSPKKVRPYSKLSPFNMTMVCRKPNPESVGGKFLYSESVRQFTKQCEKNNKLQEVLGRIKLPIVNEGDSYFTVLDNIHLPINYIKGQIPKLKKGLAEQIPKMQQIGSDMRQFKKAQLIELAQIQEKGLAGFAKLRKMLTMDRASHHDYILRTKKSFKQCIDYLPNYYESLETTKQRLLNLQTTIFSNTPFELAFNNPAEEAEADKITYF